MAGKKSIIGVYIIESLDRDDEKRGRYEGKMLYRLLKIIGIKVKYIYIRTKLEFEAILKEFCTSDYRYLYLSCHGGKTCIGTTYDTIELDELVRVMASYIDKKRLFLSSCEATNSELAEKLLLKTKCYSVIGTDEEIDMGAAAIFWGSFYYKMFDESNSIMSRKVIKRNIVTLSKLYDVKMKYFASSKDKKGYREII